MLEPPWERLHEMRCEMKAYCKFHDLSVFKVRSADLHRDSIDDIEKIKVQFIREINIIERKLEEYHQRRCPSFNIYNNLTQYSNART